MPYGTRECALWDEGEPYSRGECSYPQAGKKGQRLFGNDPTVFQTCVLGLSLQGWISIQNRPPLTMKWDCLISLPHRVIRATILFINLDVCLEDLPCLDSSCLPRMVNQLESGKLKFESKYGRTTQNYWARVHWSLLLSNSDPNWHSPIVPRVKPR